MSAPSTSRPAAPSTPKKYVRAVGPRLRTLLLFVFALVALLGANSAYLAGITALEWAKGGTYQNYFYQYMFLAHLALGLLLIVPFIVFGVIHLLNSRNRRNRRAVRVGYVLFAVSILVLVSGLLLMRVSGLFDLKQPLARTTVYWLHIGSPLAAAWLYWLHRLAGPRIKWRLGLSYTAAVGAVVLGMALLHSQDPRKWNVAGPQEGEQYFLPSLARTATGNFIPEKTLMMDDYCLKCHQDAYNDWFHSAHHFSSFNNPPYLASVSKTREVALKRDGQVNASRWCAGCHDPVPFFSGKFDDPDFDMVKHPTSQAGITCTVCHAITHVNSTRGNADYTIEEPIHYPFAQSENKLLQFINQQLVKAKPSLHKKTFLKPAHKTAEFCSTCHKVHLPYALNHYREFLPGQNHYDPYLLSGVSGHGARSFYYPDVAKKNCAECHMPLAGSNDFGAKLFAGAKELSIHSHLFPAANTGLAWLKDCPEVIQAEQEFLAGSMRVDIFGLREGGGIDGELIGPLRPEVPELEPGKKYLLETVLRTMKLGHLFTQGTVDSNEVWVDVTVTSGGQVIGRSGGMSDDREVDPWSHFVNVFMLDKDGNRIDRRNPEDIFVPLYNHQIPPGAGQVAHYGLELPEELSAPVTVEVKLQYRKFDKTYMDFVAKTTEKLGAPLRGRKDGEAYKNELPITTLAEDRITFPVAGVDERPENADSPIDVWQRWNDYGIGLLLEGQAGAKGELRQAADAFLHVEALGRFDGPLNLARVYYAEGRLDEAVEAIRRAAVYADPPAPAWTLGWLSGLVNRQQGHLAEAEENFRSVLEDRTQAMIDRHFDFSLDYEVINLHGQTLFDLAKQARGEPRKSEREAYLRRAVEQFEKTLKIDAENVTAHYNLQLLYAQLGDGAKAAEHRELHARYKPDDNAHDRAVALARRRYPAANHAAEAIVIYSLHRDGAPGLPEQAAEQRAGAGH
ncbi:MAG TPA: multiheme c-type cytochrome [Pirellulales bacterium]|nr:multiheme c-type cytochrome [Pirellulales bacterium]